LPVASFQPFSVGYQFGTGDQLEKSLESGDWALATDN
jgi:hypothetical protein